MAFFDLPINVKIEKEEADEFAFQLVPENTAFQEHHATRVKEENFEDMNVASLLQVEIDEALEMDLDSGSSTTENQIPKQITTETHIKVEEHLNEDADKKDTPQQTSTQTKEKPMVKEELNQNGETETSKPMEQNLEPMFKHHCPTCGAGFALKKNLTIHVRQQKCSQKHYTCPKCQKVFISEDNLNAHVLTHTSCDICGLIFTDTDTLEAHKDEQHNDKELFQCSYPDCKRFYKSQKILKRHVGETHNNESRFQCPICGKSIKDNRSIKEHMMRHSEVRSFKCEQCERAFFTSGELKKHIRRHIGERPYSCDICQKTYLLSCDLTNHKRSHTGERPYACTDCPMRYMTIGGLKSHRLSHTGEKMFKCNVCPREFTQKRYLKYHMERHKAKEEPDDV